MAITTKELVDLYFQKKKIKGKSPTCKEFIDFTREKGVTNWILRSRFGNWGNFVTKECGDETIQKRYRGELCKVKNCLELACSKGFCMRHYRQNKSSGLTRERFETDKNKIIVKKDRLEVIVFSWENNREEIILIDLEFLDKIKNIKISYRPSKGACALEKGKSIYLTKYLYGNLDNSYLVYFFKNRDNRDLRRNNIKIVNCEELARRRCLPKNNTSGHKGISWNKKNKTYMARIGHKGKDIYLGSSSSLSEAIKLREKGEIKYWGKKY